MTSNPPYLLRKANNQDAEALQRFIEGHGFHSWDLDTVRGELGLTSSKTWLMEGEGHKILGFLIVRSTLGEHEIVSIGVDPAQRRMGLAKKLLGFFISGLQAGDKVFLEVSATNIGAQKLYNCFGFQKVGLRKAYYGDGSDALVLSLST